MESPGLPLHLPCYRGASPANPREEGCKHQEQDPGFFHLACLGGLKTHTPATSRISASSAVCGDGYSPAVVLPGRAAYSVCDGGWYIFSPAELPADPVRVRLWLFVSGVVAWIVDEVYERITQEAAEDRKEREREQKPN